MRRTTNTCGPEIYDRELTAENLFAIQSEISNAIAEQLHATLSPDEQERINAMPTANLEAYDAYLKGRQLLTNRLSAEMEQAIGEFEKAVELDPAFALAWTNLAYTQEMLAEMRDEPLENTRAARQAAIDRALELDPLLGEAWIVSGHPIRRTESQRRSRACFPQGNEETESQLCRWVFQLRTGD